MFKLKNNFLCFLLISLCFLSSTNALAAAKKKDAALNITGTNKITAEEIFTLIDEFPELLIIDARIRTDRAQGYIEGSVSLPDIETNCSSLKKFIPVKTSPVLFYCNGVKCGRSGKSSKVAVKCGYKNIYWFRGGFDEWKSKNLPYVKSNK